MSYKVPNNIIKSRGRYYFYEWNTVKKWAVGYKWSNQNVLSIIKKYRKLEDAMAALKDHKKNNLYNWANEYVLLKVDYSDIKEEPTCYQESQPVYTEINHIFLREKKLKRILIK